LPVAAARPGTSGSGRDAPHRDRGPAGAASRLAVRGHRDGLARPIPDAAVLAVTGECVGAPAAAEPRRLPAGTAGGGRGARAARLRAPPGPPRYGARALGERSALV